MTTSGDSSKIQQVASEHIAHKLILARPYCKYHHALVLKITESTSLMQAAQGDRSSKHYCEYQPHTSLEEKDIQVTSPLSCVKTLWEASRISERAPKQRLTHAGIPKREGWSMCTMS